MELRQYFALVRRWWWLIVLLAVVGIGAAYGFTQLREPVYEATTTVLINQAPGALPDADAVLQGQRVASTYGELLQQRPVLEQVIEALNLELGPEELDRQITVVSIRDTNLLELTVQDTDPIRAAQIANEVVNVFIDRNVEFQESRYASSIENLESELDSTRRNITQLEEQLAKYEGGTGLSSNELAERDSVRATLSDYRSTYATLLDRYEEVRLARAQTTDKVSVVETALPGERAGFSSALMAAVGGVIGAGLSLGAILLIDSLDDTVRSVEAAEALTGVTALGLIGRLPVDDDVAEALVTARYPRSSDAEAYRVLRANLDSLAVDSSISSILVTSSGPMEGKTTTAANLGVALAQAGKRVILVDMDLRRPVLHKLFGLNNRQGVTTALLQAGFGNLGEHIFDTEVENLHVMPSGPLPPNPADLLEARHTTKMLEDLRAYADVVIFDSPPVLAVADPILLARRCDAVLLVVLSERTKSAALRKAKEQLSQAGVSRLGVVLNRVSASRDGYYYRYQYYYSSGAQNGSGH